MSQIVPRVSEGRGNAKRPRLRRSKRGRYGSLGLYVGGTGEVRFKDLGYKDLNRREVPAEETSDQFRIRRLDDFYYSWSAAVADVNRDGHMDVIAGPFYYLGPN